MICCLIISGIESEFTAVVKTIALMVVDMWLSIAQHSMSKCNICKPEQQLLGNTACTGALQQKLTGLSIHTEFKLLCPVILLMYLGSQKDIRLCVCALIPIYIVTSMHSDIDTSICSVLIQNLFLVWLIYQYILQEKGYKKYFV